MKLLKGEDILREVDFSLFGPHLDQLEHEMARCAKLGEPVEYAYGLIEEFTGQPGKGKLIAECHDKLQRRWAAYEAMGLDFEKAERRYNKFKRYLEKVYNVIL